MEQTLSRSQTTTEDKPTSLTVEALRKMDAYWRAANYLSVGQIYLLDNPLLDEPLTLEHVKLRLLGHWGTTPGLNFIYVHLNRVIKAWDLNMVYVTGPGHGAPGIVANTWLEGSYTELYPDITQDQSGMKKLFRQFTTDKPIIFAFHGYPWLIHRLAYRRTNHNNLHVRGYKEEGTTTTPFDMAVLNDLDRFHLVMDVIDHVPKLGYRAAYLKQRMRDKLTEHKQYIARVGQDMPEIRDRKWRHK